MYPPIYKTKRLVIKPYEPTDEDAFVEMALDPMSVQFIGGANGIEAEERAVFKKGFEIYKSNKKRWFWLWGIYIYSELCGHLELKETDHTNNNELEIIYIIHPSFRNKGIMTEVFEFFKQEQHNWKRRIIATVDHDNIYSLALLNKWGIEKKETIKDAETGEEYLKITLVE